MTWIASGLGNRYEGADQYLYLSMASSEFFDLNPGRVTTFPRVGIYYRHRQAIGVMHPFFLGLPDEIFWFDQKTLPGRIH